MNSIVPIRTKQVSSRTFSLLWLFYKFADSITIIWHIYIGKHARYNDESKVQTTNFLCHFHKRFAKMVTLLHFIYRL